MGYISTRNICRLYSFSESTAKRYLKRYRAEVGRRYKPETIIETPGLVRVDARAFQYFMLNYKLLKNEATHGLAREYKE